MEVETTVAEFLEAQRAYYSELWELVLANENTLRGVIRHHCRQQYHLLDEIWSDVVLVAVPRAMKTFDPEKGDFDRHINHTVKWYVYKWLNARLKRNDKEPSLSNFVYINRKQKEMDLQRGTVLYIEYEDKSLSSVSERETVQTILERMPTYERSLLHLRIVLEWSYVEIARRLETDEITARKECDNALHLAKMLADRLR